MMHPFPVISWCHDQPSVEYRPLHTPPTPPTMHITCLAGQAKGPLFIPAQTSQEITMSHYSCNATFV